MSVFYEVHTQILHGLRLKGFADEPALTKCLELWQHLQTREPQTSIEVELAALETSGFIRLQEAPFRAWTLTAEGRQYGQQLLKTELTTHQTTDAEQQIIALYEQFLPTNKEFLEICTAWQTRTIGGQMILNDHSDIGYDQRIITRLHDADKQIRPICDGLSEVLQRFDNYRTRFSHALCHIVEGNYDWFTKLTIDSYHTIWFELHEDLLATLGRHRTQE